MATRQLLVRAFKCFYSEFSLAACDIFLYADWLLRLLWLWDYHSSSKTALIYLYFWCCCWSQRGDGMGCDVVLTAQGAVSALCIDQVNGCIVAGVQEIIRWRFRDMYDKDIFLEWPFVVTQTGNANVQETYWMSFCSVGTVSRKQAMRVCDECCSKITGANATQFFLFHFQGLWSRHTQDCAEESWTQRFCAMYYSYSWEESGIYRFFSTVVVISLLGTVWYDFENRVQTSGVEMRLRILCLNFMVFRPQTPRMSNFECSWVCFQFLLTRYLTLFF